MGKSRYLDREDVHIAPPNTIKRNVFKKRCGRCDDLFHTKTRNRGHKPTCLYCQKLLLPQKQRLIKWGVDPNISKYLYIVLVHAVEGKEIDWEDYI